MYLTSTTPNRCHRKGQRRCGFIWEFSTGIAKQSRIRVEMSRVVKGINCESSPTYSGRVCETKNRNRTHRERGRDRALFLQAQAELLGTDVLYDYCYSHFYFIALW